MIFLDEINEISLESNSTLTTLIKCIASIRLEDKVMIIAAANDRVNPKLTQLGWFDYEISFDSPVNEERMTILKLHLSKFENEIKDEDIE